MKCASAQTKYSWIASLVKLRSMQFHNSVVLLFYYVIINVSMCVCVFAALQHDSCSFSKVCWCLHLPMQFKCNANESQWTKVFKILRHRHIRSSVRILVWSFTHSLNLHGFFGIVFGSLSMVQKVNRIITMLLARAWFYSNASSYIESEFFGLCRCSIE